MNTQLIISNTDVVTLLVEDYVNKIQQRVDVLFDQSHNLGNERDTLTETFFREVILKFNEANKGVIESFITAFKTIWKNKKIIAINDYDNNEAWRNIFKFYKYDLYDRNCIGLYDIKEIKSGITIQVVGSEADEDEEELGYTYEIEARRLKSLKLNKEMISQWKQIQKLDTEVRELTKQRMSLEELIKDKDSLKSKAIAEMTRNALANSPEVMQLVQKSLGAMNIETKMIEVES